MDDKFAAGDYVVDRPVTHSVVFGELSDCPPVLHDELKFFNIVWSIGSIRLPLPQQFAAIAELDLCAVELETAT